MVVAPDETVAVAGADADAPEVPCSERKGSRGNATKHSLTAKKIFETELAFEIEQLTAMYKEHFRPACPYELAQVEIMGRSGAQLERLEQLRIADMERGMDRAALCFETDRRALVVRLASRISHNPSGVSRELARSKQGAEWLIDNLQGLLRIWRSEKMWTDDQYEMASDLLGVPHVLRTTGETSAATVASLAATAALVVERLERDLDHHLIALNEGARAMAMAGAPGEPDLETKQHRKYENAARREYNRALAELRLSQAQGSTATTTTVASAGVSQRAGGSQAVADVDSESDSHSDPDPETDPDLDSDLASEFECEVAASEDVEVDRIGLDVMEVVSGAAPVSLDELGAVHPQAARVASNVSRVAGPKPGGDHDRRRTRAQRKADRKAARQTGR